MHKVLDLSPILDDLRKQNSMDIIRSCDISTTYLCSMLRVFCCWVECLFPHFFHVSIFGSSQNSKNLSIFNGQNKMFWRVNEWARRFRCNAVGINKNKTELKWWIEWRSERKRAMILKAYLIKFISLLSSVYIHLWIAWLILCSIVYSGKSRI